MSVSTEQFARAARTVVVAAHVLETGRTRCHCTDKPTAVLCVEAAPVMELLERIKDWQQRCLTIDEETELEVDMAALLAVVSQAT